MNLQPTVCMLYKIALLMQKNKASSFLTTSFDNICKATTVTRTKRIDRSLLRREAGFACCTSSVLRRGRRVKQKERIAHCCSDWGSRLQRLRIAGFFHNCGSSTGRGRSTGRRAQIATAMGRF